MLLIIVFLYLLTTLTEYVSVPLFFVLNSLYTLIFHLFSGFVMIQGLIFMVGALIQRLHYCLFLFRKLTTLWKISNSALNTATDLDNSSKQPLESLVIRYYQELGSYQVWISIRKYKLLWSGYLVLCLTFGHWSWCV